MEQTVNKWWKGTDFRTMEQITRLRTCNFCEEDGYQEFIDVCNEFWKQLPLEEKITIYNEFN